MLLTTSFVSFFISSSVTVDSTVLIILLISCEVFSIVFLNVSFKSSTRSSSSIRDLIFFATFAICRLIYQTIFADHSYHLLYCLIISFVAKS